MMAGTTRGTDDPGPYRNVLVIGASGEIGAAIALCHARRGAGLWLWGRNAERLQRTTEACLAAGAGAVTIRLIDLENMAEAQAAIEADDAAAQFTTAVFAAGAGDIREPGRILESAALIARLGTINYTAPAAMAAALGERMARRRGGGLVLIGSAAAFHALPFGAGYSSSKAGLTRFAQALRIALKPHHVTVTLASPGFVDTAAARRVPGPKPGMISPEAAAERIVAAGERGVGHLVLPRRFALLWLLDRLMPVFLRDRLLQALAPPGV